MHEPSIHLALLLDAPLQSWGYQSKFDRRTTLSHPTRSGILGMLCAAMGIDRADSKRLASFTDLGLTVLVFRNDERLIDYHTVGGGWNKKTDRQKIVPKANGGIGTTVVTRREYMQSSRFGAILAGSRAQIEEIAAAVANPKWGVWLGRKSCIPASPVCQGVFESEQDAIDKLIERNGGRKPSRVCRETDSFEEGTDTIMDVPLDFKNREFAPRRIQVE